MRDPLPLAGALAVLGAVGLLLVGERDPGFEGERDRDRLLAYDLSRPLRFSLEPLEDEIRLLTWLETSGSEVVDVRVTTLYALGIEVHDSEGARVLERRLWLPTHLNRVSAEDLGAPQRVVDTDRVLWDDRSAVVDVSGLVPAGGTITVTAAHVPRGADVLVVGFRRAAADPVQVLKRVRGGTMEDDPWVAPWPLSSLPDPWQERAARWRWDRLGALPPEGGGLPATHRVEMAFERMLSADAPAVGLPVRAGQAAAWLLKAPSEVVVEALHAETLEPVAVPLQARWRTEDGAVRELEATAGRVGPLGVEVPTELRVALPAGATGPVVLRATTRGRLEDRSIGDPPRLAREGGEQWTSPDLRQVDGWRAAPDAPLAWTLRPGEDLRIGLRPRLGPGPLPGLEPGVPEGSTRASIEVFDDSGASLARYEVDVPRTPSAFERYVRGDEWPARVSVPLLRYLHPPPEARRMVIGADAVVDATLDATADPDAPWIPMPDYEPAEEAGVRMVYTPFDERPWQARHPDDPEALVEEGRSVAVDAQVRWEPVDGGGGGDGVPVRATLLLRGPYEVLAEPARADGGSRVALGSAPRAVPLSASGRLSVDYRVDRARVGSVARLTIDGRTLERRLEAAGGTLRVDRAGTGSALVAVDVPGLFLARVEGVGTWNEHRSWGVPPGSSRGIPLPAGEGDLLVEVYRPVGAMVRALWHVEGDDVAVGMTEDFEPRSGVSEAPSIGRERARSLSFAGEELEALRPVRVRRGPDQGPATLVVAADGDETLWIRARATWAVPLGAHDRHAWQGEAP